MALALHSRILRYTANEAKTRQYKQPIFAKGKPFYWKNNIVKERFTILFNIFFQPDFGSDKIFKDICLVALFSEFVKSMLKNVECNIWAKLIKRCFNDNSGNIEKHFTFRFSIYFVSWWTCDKIRRLKLCSNSFAIYTSTAAIIILFWNCWFLFGGSTWNEAGRALLV